MGYEEFFYYDLWGRMRRNPKLLQAVRDGVGRIARIEQEANQGKASRDDLAQEMANLLPLCGYNYGMLIPYIFPAYPYDTPMSLITRPFMFAMSCLAPNSIVTLRAGRQVGKCADGSTRVRTRRHGEMTLEGIFNQGLAREAGQPPA